MVRSVLSRYQLWVCALLPFLLNGVATGLGQSAVPAAIQRLHQEDIAATLANDPRRLANLFTDDGILLGPDAPPRVGRAAILAANLREQQTYPNEQQLAYTPTIHDVRVNGDWAVEWFEFTAGSQEQPGAPVKAFRAKGLRVLRRLPDGSWRFSHVAWSQAN